MNWTRLAFYARKVYLAWRQWKAKKSEPKGQLLDFTPPVKSQPSGLPREKKAALIELQAKQRKKQASPKPPKDAA
jgi:hypothetical protein